MRCNTEDSTIQQREILPNKVPYIPVFGQRIAVTMQMNLLCAGCFLSSYSSFHYYRYAILYVRYTRSYFVKYNKNTKTITIIYKWHNGKIFKNVMLFITITKF